MDEETISKIWYHLHFQEYLKDSHSLLEEKGKWDGRHPALLDEPGEHKQLSRGNSATEVLRSFTLRQRHSPRFCNPASLTISHKRSVLGTGRVAQRYRALQRASMQPAQLAVGAARGTAVGSPCTREKGSVSPGSGVLLLLGIFCHVTATSSSVIKVLLFLFCVIK